MLSALCSKTARATALFIGLATAAHTADPAIEQLFKLAREKVAQNIRRVPRYACVETISRARYQPTYQSRPTSCTALIAARKQLNSPGAFTWRDRLRLDVAVVNGSEMFSWAGGGQFDTDKVDTLTGGGASGSGDFAGFLGSVFGNDAEKITWRGIKNSLGWFEYSVPLAKSHYTFHTTGPEKLIAYSGSFFVDPENGDLQRMTVESGEFPAGEPVCKVDDSIDYQKVKIGGNDFLLPDLSVMDVLYKNGTEARNETRYSDCREYTAESTIRFDDNDAGATAASNQALIAIPSKLHLKIALAGKLNAETAAAGDEIAGTLTEDARDKKLGTIAHAGDKVFGRILRLEQETYPAPHWNMVLRFDSIERGGTRQPLNAKPAGKDVFVFPERGNLILDQKFHSEWETR